VFRHPRLPPPGVPRARAVLTAFCLACTTLAGAGAPTGVPGTPVPEGPPLLVEWFAENGASRWKVDLVSPPVTAGAGNEGGERLHAPPWYLPLPALEFDLVGGGRARLHDRLNGVLLVDFWATWCQPCLRGLPWLQEFQETHRDRGIDVMTVNVGEDDGAVRDFAAALGLELPVARYDAAVREAFEVELLPTLVVVDRRGRLRARFDGYAEGIERTVARLVESLIEETPAPGPEIAEVLAGHGRVEVAWSRTAAANVRGLVVAPAAGSRAAVVLAASGWEVTGFDGRGKDLGLQRVARGVDFLRLHDVARDPRSLVGFRPAGRRVVPFVFGGEIGEAWESPAPIFDLCVEAAAGEAPPTLLLATLSGLHRVDPEGGTLASRVDLGRVVQVERAGGGPIVLGVAGRLIWLDADLNPIRERQVAEAAGMLMVPPGRGAGVGVASASVDAVAVGAFLADGPVQVALVANEQLIVLDADSGRERFRARWPGIAALAAGDLDGDGRDELVVGAGKRVTVLARPAF